MDSEIPPALLRDHPELVSVGEALRQVGEGVPVTAMCLECKKTLVVESVEATGSLVIRCPDGHTFFRAKRAVSRFAQPTYSGKAVLTEAIAADDPGLASMIIAAALEEDDREFVEAACIRLSRHRDETVRGNAILGFGHIARLFGQLGGEPPAIVKAALRDPSRYVRGQANAAAGDLEQFLGIRSRLRATAVEFGRGNPTGLYGGRISLSFEPDDSFAMTYVKGDNNTRWNGTLVGGAFARLLSLDRTDRISECRATRRVGTGNRSLRHWSSGR